MLNKIRNILLIILLGLCACGVQAQVFVSSSATDDSGNGLSWETAKRTVGAALAVAGGSGHVCVMAGLYEEATELVIPSGVTVTGGYATTSTGTDTTQRQLPGANSQWTNLSRCTVLDGGMTHRVATVQTGGKLEGCVVRHGKSAVNGGGVLADGGTVSHCVITLCMAHGIADDQPAKGGGVYVQNNGILLNSVVCFNRADNGYGAAAASGSVTNNTITRNYGFNCGTVTDYDNNVYATVLIGEQCWMRENLRVTHFADGTAISNVLTTSTSEPRYYNAGTSAAETEIFGLLYNVAAARHGTQSNYTDNAPSGMQGVCPNGWHLPSTTEFSQLASWLAADNAYYCGQSANNLAKALAATEYWQTSDVNCAVGNDLSANNITLFDARPAGSYNGSFNGLYTQGFFWTTSRNGSSNSDCVYWTLSYDNAAFSSNYTTSDKGFSVRCVKN